MAAEETGAAELTPEQKIEEMILGPAEPEPQAEVPEDEASAEEVELSEAGEEGQEIEDDPDGEGEELQAEPEPELFDVEWNGKTYEVDADLRDALEQSSDYTQKTQALAEDRKAVDVMRDELTQRQQEYQFIEEVKPETDKIQQLDWQVDQLRQYMRDNIDGLTGNQLEKVRWQIDELNAEKDGIVTGIRSKYAEFQQATEQAQKELRDKSTESLKSRLPNWSDEAENQSRAYGREVGFSDAELDQALDPRERQVLWEASEYRRIKAGAGETARKLKRGPKLQTKSRSTVTKETKRKISIRKRLNNAGGDQKAKAKIIQEDIASRLGL
jgi:hypothetical protein